ncbi:MAG: M28 family metallopeptidase [Acidobacteria bacterium]|nr:M28 family metallopeptidase [Acidobacteriota bacterium]
MNRLGFLSGAALAGALGGWSLLASQGEAGAIFGFTQASSSIERALERRFLSMPRADLIEQAHALLTAEPHAAGSARDRALAEWVRDRWREYGLDRVEIVEHQVLAPSAVEVVVEMPGGAPPWRASMREAPLEAGPPPGVEIGPAYHAFSASGDITAPVVFAGAGTDDEYDWLEAHGIAVKGRIALVRYSVPYVYRGFKAWTAQRRGAAGILIYSDPADDGSRKGPAYPDGPWGPDSRIQRGAIGYTFNVPGDPLTPGWASVPGARRVAVRDAPAMPAILSAPLSARDAGAILRALDGPDVPRAWQGGLPLAYRAGGTTTVHMRVRMDDAVRPIWSVIGRIAGSERPDDLVVVGNHRDAWVFGGVDPATGTAALMELARTLGGLAQRGWLPKRTIVFASWDGEELALTGSTEWGEQNERTLSAHAVAYINVDSAASGATFQATAVPSLNRLVREAADVVVDPESGRSIAASARRGPDLVNNRIGTGSDYSVFLNHLGVPIADLSFTGPYGVYHSAYDTHRFVQRFGDPGFRYQLAMTRLWGLIALRLANADLLPFDYRPYAARVREFIEEVRSSQPPHRASLPLLRQAADRFSAAAGAAGTRMEAVLASIGADEEERTAINQALMAVERAFVDPNGLAERPWYRHLIYAPAPSYQAEPVPGVAEAVRSGDPQRVAAEAERLARALDRAAAILDPAP